MAEKQQTEAITRRARMYLTFLPTTHLQTCPSDVGDIEHEPVKRQRRLLPGDALCGSFSSRWREPRESKYLFMHGCSMLSLARRGSDWNDLLVRPHCSPSASRWNLMSFCTTLRVPSVRCFISGRFYSHVYETFALEAFSGASPPSRCLPLLSLRCPRANEHLTPPSVITISTGDALALTDCWIKGE